MSNRVHLIGNVGKEPEIRTVGDVQVANFSLATSESYKDKNGEKKTVTQWHNIQIWRGLADVVSKLVHKGDKLYVSGKVTYREYEKDGVKRQITEIVCDDMEMLSSAAKSNTATSAPVVTESVLVDDLPF
jgi:single-strand DNA-binding protein